MLENFPTSEWPFWGGGWGLKQKWPLAGLRDRGGNGRCPLMLRESRGEDLLSLFIFPSSLKVDDEINLNS